MLYLGIDQHARQITISLRDEGGDVLLARQVSTRPEKVHAFFEQLTRQRLSEGESFVAVLEVCGFNDWLIRMLHEYHCRQVILIQPDQRTKCKAGRRDAAALSELLWVNRERLLQGKPARGLRRVAIASSTDQENRRLTTLRKEAGQARTRTALGLLPSRALPSAQASGIVGAPQGLSNRTNQGGEKRREASARLFDRSCLAATRDPSRWGQLESDRGCGGISQQWPRPAARRSGWGGPYGEEFAPNTSASARARCRAELLTIIVSGTLRRDVLGAIASAKNDRNFP